MHSAMNRSEQSTKERGVAYSIEFILTVTVALFLFSIISFGMAERLASAEESGIEGEFDRIAEETASAIEDADSLQRYAQRDEQHTAVTETSAELRPDLPESVGEIYYTIRVDDEDGVVTVSGLSPTGERYEGTAAFETERSVNAKHTIAQGTLRIEYDDDEEAILITSRTKS